MDNSDNTPTGLLNGETWDLIEPVHLGDGVYAEFDGFNLWLRAERDDGWHHVAIEPEVYRTMRSVIQSDPRIAKHFGEAASNEGMPLPEPREDTVAVSASRNADLNCESSGQELQNDLKPHFGERNQ